MQKGFIALPILALIILGLTVVAGGGYAVYKINKLESESSQKVADLEEKLNQVGTTTNEQIQQLATTTETASEQVLTQEEIDKIVSQVTAPNTVSSQGGQPSSVQTDICSNFSGIQTSVPVGFKISNGSCVQIEDKCFNIEGTQESIPSGMLVFKGYGCMTENEMDEIEGEKIAANSEQREIEELSGQCSDLKTVIYEMDQSILEIKEVYQEKISKVQAGGGSVGEVQRYTNTFNSQMYAEIAPIELERDKKTNEYNYLCT